MSAPLIYPAGSTQACACAAARLKALGLSLTDHPTPEVTHLLLDVPSFTPEGSLRGGGDPEALLKMLPEQITVIGGNLVHPCLEGRPCLDLLKLEDYLFQNAAITAHCALGLAADALKTTFPHTPTLIIGWGRIGKCLARMLRSLDAPLTVAARREESRAALRALGYTAVSMEQVPSLLDRTRLLINTAPEPVLGEDVLSAHSDCVKMDLASQKGLAAADVLWARGLPGLRAPESSGRLIAETIVREGML